MRKVDRNWMIFLLITALLLPSLCHAAPTDETFKAIYDFMKGAAEGYLGRSIAIGGGLAGLFYGAGTGKILPVIGGTTVGIAGALGPTITEACFKSAQIF